MKMIKLKAKDRERIMYEAETIKELDHPMFIKYIDYFQIGKMFYIVMEQNFCNSISNIYIYIY